jgi:outer membrane protein assembly factor BamE
MKRRNEPIEIKQFSVYFTGDELARYEGAIAPAADPESRKDKKEIIVSVPDYAGDKGIVEKGLNLIGIDLDE